MSTNRRVRKPVARGPRAFALLCVALMALAGQGESFPAGAKKSLPAPARCCDSPASAPSRRTRRGARSRRRVRAKARAVSPYLILLTAKSGKEDVVEGLEAGANDYVAKPFDPAELRARLGVGLLMLALQQSLADRVAELEEALSQVKQLQGLLPVCSYCKSIRDDKNYWQQVESYIGRHSGVQFSHSICPDCYARAWCSRRLTS